jgi:hypothetical protein
VDQSALVAPSQFFFALANDLHRAVKTQPRLRLRTPFESSGHEILLFEDRGHRRSGPLLQDNQSTKAA